MKKAVFFTYTEYHLLTSYIIQKEIANQYDLIKIYAIASEKRLNFDCNYQSSNCEIISVKMDSAELVDIINKTINVGVEKVFIFNEDEPLMVYLMVKLKKTKIALVQDGLKPYTKVNKKHEFISTIRNTISGYKSLFKFGLMLNSLYLFEIYKYASSKQITEIWLTNPESFDNKFNKFIKTIPVLSNENTKIELFNIFRLNSEKALGYTSNVIFYVHQALPYDEFKVEEMNLLKDLRIKMGENCKMYIKIHPLANIDLKNSFVRELNAEIIENMIPAELYILQLKKSIVLSAWSTALLNNNLDCKFYYTMNLMPWNFAIKQLNPYNPTQHIKTISSINQIIF